MTRKISAWLQLSVAASLALSVIWQVSDRISFGLFHANHYFAYVTIQVCLFAIVVLGYQGSLSVSNRTVPSWLSWAQLFVVSWMTVVAVTYNLLLRGLLPEPSDAAHPWPDLPNEIMHVWAPIAIIVNWFLISQSLKLELIHIWCTLYYSVGWGAVTMILGYTAGWWPYWFMNPAKNGGPPNGAIYLTVITAFMLLVTWGFIELGNLKVRSNSSAKV